MNQFSDLPHLYWELAAAMHDLKSGKGSLTNELIAYVSLRIALVYFAELKD